jgi:hypothetical protein
MELESEIIPSGNPDSAEKQHALAAPRPLRCREFHPVVGAAVAIREHAANRMVAVHMHAHGGVIP